MEPCSRELAVLIADAEPATCRVLEATLARGLRVVVCSATSGRDALRLAVERPFSIVLWDIRLRDQEDALPRIRALCPTAAVVLTTTDGLPQTLPDLASLDVAGSLSKPFNLDTLVARLQAVSAWRTPPAATVGVGIVKVGQRVGVRSAAGACVTRVMDLMPSSFVVVGAPRAPVPPDVAPGLKLAAQVWGVDALYTFNTHVLGESHTAVPGWELRLPRSIQRHQRRRRPRYGVRSMVALRDTKHRLIGAGRMENLSLGGSALVLDRPISAGQDASLEILGLSVATLPVRILRCSHATPAAAADLDGDVEVAVRFTSSARRIRAVVKPLLPVD